MNVGASRPEDAGLYFSWGNIDGVSADDAAAVAAMTQAAYANSTGASINRDLSFATEDAAMAIMGEDWCMPSSEDLQELITECDWDWITINGINGYRVKSRTNNNSIFIPAAGDIGNGALSSVNVLGTYWSSSIASNDQTKAYTLYINDSEKSSVTRNRYYGRNIRARLA